MTGDDVVKSIFAAMLTVLGASVAWLVRTVLGTDKQVLLNTEQLKVLEGKLADSEKNKVTVECVRDVIEEALEKRDKQAEQRRAEYDIRHKLEVEAAIANHLDKMIPRIVREIRGTTGVTPRPPKDGDSS